MSTYIKIATVTVPLLVGSATIDFTSIPTTYTDLCLKLSARTTSAYLTDKEAYFYVKINTDVTAGSARQITGNGSSSASANSSNPPYGGYIPSNNATASTFSNGDIYFSNYLSGVSKSWSSDQVMENNATGSFVNLTAGLWANNTAINAITVYPASAFGNFAQYSSATLYGISKS